MTTFLKIYLYHSAHHSVHCTVQQRLSPGSSLLDAFLYLGLAGAVAEANGLDRMHLFNNGVESLTLPLSTDLGKVRSREMTNPLSARTASAAGDRARGEPG
jgi:hypothetical protein